jgi:hypothetical protein
LHIRIVFTARWAKAVSRPLPPKRLVTTRARLSDVELLPGREGGLPVGLRFGFSYHRVSDGLVLVGAESTTEVRLLGSP